MKMELEGIISELLSETTGLILGEDHCYYLFSTADFISEHFIPIIGGEVIFKPVIRKIGEEEIRKALLIEKKETTDI